MVGDDTPFQKEDERGREGEPRRRQESRDEPGRVTAEVAARVRHEINNPLTGLLGQAQLLLRDDTLSETARRRVEVIEHLAKRIRDAVAELRVAQAPAGGAAATKTGAHAPETGRAEEEPPRH